jgi:cytochrome c553
LNGAPVGINFTAANLSVHNGTNSNNATQQGYAPIIGACWACHDTDGNVTSGHPDRYKAPKTCSECHLGSGTYNASAYNALIVSEHYYNGAQIKAGNSTSNISSCINCHENVSEMILYNNDSDTGSFSGDGIRLSGGNMSFYHYGANRTADLRIGASANCSYCHQNASTAFNRTMVNENNKSILNHSQSSSPNCFNANCHDSGWLHNSTLTKPTFSLPNSSLCLKCHGTSSGNASITNLSQHNGTVNCTSCHLGSARNIHPVQYLQPDASFKDNSPTNKSSAVNCTNCHQNATLFPGAPIIPDPLKHSSNLTNGSIWGNYWTSENNSCYYCHNNTKHNATALGKVSALLNANNTREGVLTRSEERRVGKECRRLCRSRWSPYH